MIVGANRIRGDAFHYRNYPLFVETMKAVEDNLRKLIDSALNLP
jgi:hypothetical protein